MISCPRRQYESGPWQQDAEGKDCWETRWIPGDKFWASKDGDGNITSWQIGWPLNWPKPPLACSFCGCSRPSDVVTLIRDHKWELELAKRYKFYVHPAGYFARMEQAIADAKNGIERSFPKGTIDDPIICSSPVPPIKIYTHHLTSAEVDWFIKMSKSNS